MADATSAAGATIAVAASALRAQQARMRVIAENIANADSAATTAGGDPSQRPRAAPPPGGRGGAGAGAPPGAPPTPAALRASTTRARPAPTPRAM